MTVILTMDRKCLGSRELGEEVEEVDLRSRDRALVDVVGADPGAPDGTLVLRMSVAFHGERQRLTPSGSLCMRASSPTLSTKVLGMARARTVRLLCMLSYKSECSSSFCRLLSVLESWSEMKVRDTEPLQRRCSLAMLHMLEGDLQALAVLTKCTRPRRSRKSSFGCPGRSSGLLC